MQVNDDGGTPPTDRRTGDFSDDGHFNPDSLFDVIAQAENAEQATQAMRLFVAQGDADALKQAIALYTRSARARGRTIENVLAELNVLSARQHYRYNHQGKLLEPSELKKLVLGSVLEGFGES